MSCRIYVDENTQSSYRKVTRPSVLPKKSHRMKLTRFLSGEFALGKVCQLYILIEKFAIYLALIDEPTETKLKIVEFECFIDNKQLDLWIY